WGCKLRFLGPVARDMLQLRCNGTVRFVLRLTGSQVERLAPWVSVRTRRHSRWSAAMSQLVLISFLAVGPPVSIGLRPSSMQPAPDSIRPMISAAEREALGLSPCEGGAKVHPAVYAALAGGKAAMPPYSFQGWVYVAIRLSHQQVGAENSPENF